MTSSNSSSLLGVVGVCLFFASVSASTSASATAQDTVGTGSPAVNAPGGIAAAAEAPRHPIELSGYAILNGAWTQSDPNLVSVGRNNGFALGDARIELTGRPAETLWLYVSIDGATPLVGPDPTQGRRTVSLKDAYGVWAPGGHIRVQAGQFKAPQDVEELLEETELKFVSRSIVSIGVTAPFGYDAAGLGLDRQIGIGVGTDRIPTAFGGVIAQVAVTNGNGSNQYLNDTQYPSVVGRAAADFFGRTLTVGVDSWFQPRGSGTRPTYFRDNLFGIGADVRYERGPLHVMLLAQARNTRHITSPAPDELALGLSAEGAWKFAGWIEPALRISRLDPSDQIKDPLTGNHLAVVTWITAGVNLYVPDAPARLALDFTHRIEDASHQLDNDGVELSAQVRF